MPRTLRELRPQKTVRILSLTQSNAPRQQEYLLEGRQLKVVEQLQNSRQRATLPPMHKHRLRLVHPFTKDAGSSSLESLAPSSVSHTGIFSASIAFTQPVNVTWINGSSETPLGYMSLSPLSASHKRATINDTTTFYIQDEAAFGLFATHMITDQNFTWRLESYNLRVQALKFPVAHGISFNKEITLNGINSFSGNVVLEDLQLPSDSPDGGINFVAVTSLNNTSPFALDLGTVVFDLAYQGVYLGTGTGTNTNLYPGANNITLNGRLVPQTSDSDLAVVSELFTNYINFDNSPVIASGKSTLQSDGSTISWLSQGLQSLALNVPFKSTSPINPIQSIQIGSLALGFTADTAWMPQADSNSVQASMKLPFGFGLSIAQIQNEFNIMSNGSTVAGLATPLGASTSSISVLSSTDTQGQINITIANGVLNCSTEDHNNFALFNTQLTDSQTTDFRLVGNSSAVANMSIGQITLNPIKVNVSTTMYGLQGLKGYTTIASVDVVGGTQQAINLSIDVSIYNPSSLDLATGDLTLQLLREGAVLGTALMPNFTLNMGNNSLTSSSNFEPNNSPQGLDTLNQFVGGNDVELAISGFSGSTAVSSLLPAFESVNITTTLPGLNSSLLTTGALTILPTTGVENNISQVTVSLANPFTAGLDITKIYSTVTSHGLNLGTIDTATNFTSAGKSTTTSPALDLDMNFDPATLFTLTRVLAVEAGLNPAPLDGVVQLGGIQYLTATNADSTPPNNQSERRDNIYTGFNLPSFVQQAFKQLRSDVQLSSEVTIGEYQTTLNYTQQDVPISTDSTLDLILPILAQPIVQKIVTGTVLGIETVMISSPQQTSFGVIFFHIFTSSIVDATISFGSGLTVSWSGQPLGSLKMQDVNIVGDVGATLNVESTFEVADLDLLTNFTKVLLTEESFDWDITGENLTGIQVSGISMPTKSVTLKAFNGLKNGVTINSFDLPSNDPAGGVHLTIQSTVTNPSQVGIELSSIAFNTYAGGVSIAPVASTSSVTLAPNSSSSLPLVGRLIPQNSSEGLATVSSVFNNFIHGLDSNVVVQGVSAGPTDVTWLNEGIQVLQVETSLPNQGKLNIIQSIDLQQLELLFTQGTEYGPMTSSNATTAAFALPFAFPVDITSLEQNITTGYNGQSFAELVLPWAPSTTDVETRIIHLTFDNVPFAVFSDQHKAFQDFLAATTMGQTQNLSLSGAANADASTAIGVLSLTDIEFSVQSSIEGLQGLDSKPVSVANLDVNHGYTDYLLITVDTALFNPRDQTIGSADISGLIITPGNESYATDVHFSPQGSAQTAAGQMLLENYLQGIDSSTTIAGSVDSTPIESLQEALSEVKLSPVTIPALHQNLIGSASLEFPTDIVQTGIASTTFTLNNPFTASINLLEVTATATFHNLTLGAIEHVDRSSDPIHADGHSNITSPSLPFNFNMDPITIIDLITIAAQQNNVNLGPLPELFGLVTSNPSYHPPVNTSVDTSAPTCVSGNQFDINDAILDAMKDLQVTLAVDSSVKLDDYATQLTFNQTNVAAITDNTALYLIGAVAAPVAQDLVNGADLKFTEANITNITNGGFSLSLQGSLTNVGPLDALIEFVEPVTVTWQGHDIATISLPPVCAAANTGVPNYQTQGTLTITDQAQFTAYATYIMHNPSFDWTISTTKLRLTALGTIFDNVSLTKNITLNAFNGLPGVTISNFQLPSDDPAGGITIQTDALIPSPAQLGIDLGTVGFDAYFENTLVGPLTGTNLFLPPMSQVNSSLSGQMVPQSGSGLDTIGKLFSEYLAADNITLSVKGVSVQPPGTSGAVTWLSTAFQSLTLDVNLPGQKYTIIQSISLSDLSVTMQNQDEAFAPLSGSQHTTAEYKNPFGFSLQVVQSTVNMILGSGGTDVAQLNLPTSNAAGGVSTGNLATLPISFQNVPLQSLNNGAFEAMFAEVTDKSSAALELKGTANVTAKTNIGNVPISGIAFDVQSSLAGINAFGGTASLSNVSITGSGGTGGSEYVVAPLTTTLNNPSNVSLETNNIALPVYYNNVMVGRAAIDPFNLAPGQNIVPTQFRYEPANANDTTAQGFLTSFLQSADVLPLTIKGDAASTPYASLQPALEGLQLSTSITGLNLPPIITHITAEITLESVLTNEISISFDIYNPLGADLVIEFVQSDAGLNGLTYAHFDQPFSNFVVPPGQTVNSGMFGNVKLTQGALASLPITVLDYLDVYAVATTRMGQGGYEIPWLHLTQLNVPTTYQLEGITLPGLQVAASSAAASPSGSIPSSSGSSSASASGSSSSSVAHGSTTSSPSSSSSVSSGGSSTHVTSSPASPTSTSSQKGLGL
ncbi:hypothetical protein SERLADRAFT_448192 [Serpula lacrymans var. lacrymans S7.9]|uniref:Uncharacterized protein n=1 Tax=Serpula lacrymans var. lacrymans (strain S7.9) TaxID=578457 RepID=F8NUB9_SERL9|nr:uncharacterized protein SERLADRAFT_448192 [Serpula lacrymans var. lacrymans S7.9]EGO25193.1 hypothetical protein SERLADRAFT_448192 [Serpula lacrymans var. lacrymans S7.9]